MKKLVALTLFIFISILNIEAQEYKQIQSRFKPEQYLHNENGTIEVGPLGAPGWHSAHWEIIPVAGTKYVHIRNRFGTKFYLHNESNKIEVGPLGLPGWHSAHWEIIPISGSGGYVQIKNRFGDGFYLHNQDGKIQVGPLGAPGWQSAQWKILGIPQRTSTPSLESLVNLAKGKSTTQSSVHHSGIGEGAKAVDGNINGLLNNNSVTYTADNDQSPYWEVDLGAVYDISSIKIYNRTDCCKDRLKDTYIVVSEDIIHASNYNSYNIDRDNPNYTSSDIYAINSNVQSNPIVHNKEARGRYVRIFQKGNSILSLAEVEVYGKAFTKIFHPKPKVDYTVRLANFPNKILSHESNDDGSIYYLKFIDHSNFYVWQFSSEENDYYSIRKRSYGPIFGLVDGEMASGTKPNTNNRRFKFVDVGDGKLIIVSALHNDDSHVMGVNLSTGRMQEYHVSSFDPNTMLFELVDPANSPKRNSPNNKQAGSDKPIPLFPETYKTPPTKPSKRFKLIDLVCIETQDDGSDEIVLNVWIDGQRIAVPKSGYQDMNEESETEQWLIDKEFTFSSSVKVEIREVDNSIDNYEDIDAAGNETIGVLELNMDSAEGDQLKSFKGPDDSHYILRFKLGDIEIMPIVYFTKAHINEYVIPAAKNGGAMVDAAFDEQKKAFDKLAEYFSQDRDSPISPVSSPEISPEAEVVLNTTITVVTGSIAGVCIESGPVGWAVGAAILAVGSATFLPAYFAGQNGLLQLEIANLSNQKLEIESFEMSSGKKVGGLNKGGVIPVQRNKEAAISFFTFRKKWGWTGIVGKIKFKPTEYMPKGMIVEFSTPFVGTSDCSVDIPGANGKSNGGKSSWNGMMKARIGMDGRNDLFPKIIVTLENDTSGNK